MQQRQQRSQCRSDDLADLLTDFVGRDLARCLADFVGVRHDIDTGMADLPRQQRPGRAIDGCAAARPDARRVAARP